MLTALLMASQLADPGFIARPVHSPMTSSNDTVENLGLAVFGHLAIGDWAFLRVTESEQGQTDLNGDGDSVDRVLHVYAIETGRVWNTGRSGAPFRFADPYLVWGVDEGEEGGVDLDGDGLIFYSPAVRDLRTQSDVFFDVPFNVSPLIATPLAKQAGEDLLLALGGTNSTLLRWKPGQRSTIPNAEYPFLRDEGHLFVPLRESSIGRDANGDGDLGDWVLQLHDLASETTLNVGLAGSPNLDPTSGELFLALEKNQDQDLNGDGLLDSAIWHAIGQDGSVENLGVGLRIPATTPLKGLPQGDHLDPSFLPFVVEELTADLNGDGDQDDRVLQHWLPRSSTLENQGIAATSIIDGSLASDGTRVTFVEIVETEQDLNSDGDKFDSFVAVTRGPGHLQLVPLALAPSFATLGPGVVVRDLVAAFVVGESQQRVDLNGDGDTQDDLLYVLDGETGDVTALLWEVELRDVVVVGDRVFALRAETPGSDFNGDGDTNDLGVLFGYDASTGQTTNYALATSNGAAGIMAAEQDLLVNVWEQAQGGTDLNGDGDALDTVAHIVRLGR